MNKHSQPIKIVIFSIILCFFVIPPFFMEPINGDNTIFNHWNFPWYQILLGCLALIFYFFYIRNKDSGTKKILSQKLISFSLSFVFGFCLLFTSFLILNGASSFFQTSEQSSQTIITTPQTPVGFIFCILTFLFSAIYEEILYRIYFSSELISIFKTKEINSSKKRILCRILFETTGTLCFAFAHIYEGYLAVLNAAFAHLILRYLYLKNRNLPGIISAHFCYNLLALYFI